MSNQKTAFLQENFLLHTELSRKLYFGYAADQPIIDFHNHLSPFEIATDHRFENMTRIWLSGDHYKWRAMRTAGIPEAFITGAASDEDKFLAWSKTVPKTIRNPLFHWTYLELKNSFGITDYLNETTASSIYQRGNEVLASGLTARRLLQDYKVVHLCTTDDPLDDLSHHQAILSDPSFGIGVTPSFRPDKSFAVHDAQQFVPYIQQLSIVSGVEIRNMDTLLEALQKRADHFGVAGCMIADHGLNQLPLKRPYSTALDAEFNRFLSTGGATPFSDPDAFVFHVLTSLCKLYHAKGWVQQFHLGAIRNNNARLKAKLGADAGFDSIGDYPQAERLSGFFNALDETDQLGKTILYNLNPADNAVFASMCGNFNDGSTTAKVQYGPAWWFLDQKNGMEQHLDILSDIGLLSVFVGMITDSRSLLSFSRHEYFRRILCNKLADDMLNGLIPNDEKWIGGMVSDICFNNAKEYLSL
jgi:glucuronate isomerase